MILLSLLFMIVIDFYNSCFIHYLDLMSRLVLIVRLDTDYIITINN